jgi:hypothetical protein
LGWGAGQNLTTGHFNIDIGNEGAAGESGTIRIGAPATQTRAFIAGIRGAAVNGTAVVVGLYRSARRSAIVAAFQGQDYAYGKASEALFSLKPVTFRYKKDIDPQGISQLAPVAEDVEKVNPDLVVRDKEENPTPCATTSERDVAQ